MAGRLAAASAVAGAAFLLVATAVALVTMEMAKAAPSAGGGIVLVLSAAVGLAVAVLLWVIGNIFLAISYAGSRGRRSRVVAGACFLAAVLHILFLAGFIELQGGRIDLDTAIVALVALLLAIGYGIAGAKRLRGPRPTLIPIG